MQITSETLAYPFRDSEWKKKAALGGLLALVSWIFFPLMWMFAAFGLRVMRQTMRGEPPTFPGWQDWRQILRDTLWYVVVIFVYTLPFFLLSLTIGAAMFAAFFIVPGAATSVRMTPQAEQALGLGMLSIMVIGTVALMIASAINLPLQFFGYVALTRAVAHESLARAFEVRQVWALVREAPTSFIIAFALTAGLQLAAVFAAGILSYTIILYCFYPVIIGLGTLYASLIMSALFGSAYREAKERLAAAGVIA